MNRYLMDVFHFFRGHEQFTIEASSKSDAVIAGKKHILSLPDSNFLHDSVKCVKKLKPLKENSHV